MFFISKPLRNSSLFLQICHCVAKQEDTLNTNWVRQGVVLYSLLLIAFEFVPVFLFRPNTYRGTCMSIEHIYMRPQGSRGI